MGVPMLSDQSQMDDFMIQSDNNTEFRSSLCSSSNSGSSMKQSISEKSSNCSSESCDDQNAEENIHHQLEKFYDDNYFYYEVNKIEDHVHQNVWSIDFDQTFDFLYLFLASFKIIDYDAIDNQEEIDHAMDLDHLRIFSK